jgi:hypothetical protein
MEATLDLSLQKIFGGGPMRDKETQADLKKPAGGGALSDRQAALEALGHLRKAQEYLRQGNWGAFGEELKKTGESLLAIEKQGSKAK